jgi:hypothetical protein
MQKQSRQAVQFVIRFGAPMHSANDRLGAAPCAFDLVRGRLFPPNPSVLAQAIDKVQWDVLLQEWFCELATHYINSLALIQSKECYDLGLSLTSINSLLTLIFLKNGRLLSVKMDRLSLHPQAVALSNRIR